MKLVEFDWSPESRVREHLMAIDDAKARAGQAARDGDFIAYKQIMGDIHALEVSLVPEVGSLVRQAA